MIGLSLLLTNLAMRRCGNAIVGLPQVAKAFTRQILRWYLAPEPLTTFFASVANEKRKNLSRSSALYKPNTYLIDLYGNQREEFVGF